tara:strand:+ start:827 stop:2407 length:1581 start_codon:yes stop_codon:yes gene_type:complete
MAVTSTGYQLNKQPIAQSFFIDEPNGIYATKVDLFFAAADATLPVQIQLRPIVNGLPSDTEIIPGSQVVVAAGSVNTDTSGPELNPTSFTFQEPIFLKGEEDYALVVTADSKDYQIYIAEINEFTFGSTEKRVNKQPVSGSLFYSQNGVTFTPAQNQDLTFVLHQAKFKHTSATVRLNNATLPKALLRNNPITTGLDSDTDATIKIFHLNHGLQVGDTVVISGATAVGGIAASNINGSRTVVSRDFTGYTVEAGANATKASIGGGSSVQATKNILYSLVYPSAATLEPRTTTITAGIKTTSARSFAGTETAFQKASNFGGIKLNQNNESHTLRMVANSTSETNELGSGVKSLDMKVNFSTADSNVSPMLDLQRTSMILVNNVIDKQASSPTTGFNVPLNFTDENATTSGSHAARHLTRVITLDSDSVGLRVLLEANVPNSCDFQLYFRTATSDEVIQDKTFTLVTPENTNPKDANPRIFREYRYLIGGQGGDLPAFTKYQLKIVMQSTNQAEVPKFQSLRSIALSV